MPIPLYILIAKDRAAMFRRGVELFRERYEGSIPERSLDDFWMVVPRHVRDSMWFVGPVEINVPVVVEHALRWASALRYRPSLEELREAEALLRAALDDWSATWLAIGRMINRSDSRFSNPHWLRDAVSHAISEQQKASRSLDEGWPVQPEAKEQEALAEMKAGQSVGLDEAFAKVAGVTAEEWLARVARHQNGPGPAGG